MPTKSAEPIIKLLNDANRAAPNLDAWVIPELDKHLGFSAGKLQKSLEQNYPSVGEGDAIKWAEPAWVHGSNAALNYRGRAIKREKMWFQLDDPQSSGSFLRYLYTGWQWNVLPATSGVGKCPELSPVVQSLNEWSAREGFAKANHFIVTRYEDGEHNIGAHLDKPKSIAPGSLITVIKTGEVGRPFKLEWLDGRTIFERVLPPGTGVVMTLEANLQTKHSVPAIEKAGVSGSIVARTIVDSVSWADVEKKIATNAAAKKKRARDE